MSSWTPISVPKETVSDDHYKLIEILQISGTKVQADQIIFVLESSKAAIDITTPTSGFLIVNPILKVGTQVNIGTVLAVISDLPLNPEDEKFQFPWNLKKSKNEAQQQPIEVGATRFSKAAMALIVKEGLDPKIFSNSSLVDRAAVEARLAMQKPIAISKKPNTKSIVLFGGGGHAKICIGILSRDKKFRPFGILNRDPKSLCEHLLGVPILGFDSDENVKKLIALGLKFGVVAIGALKNPKDRESLYNRLVAFGLKIPTLVHPSAIIESSAVIAEGCQFMAGCIVGSAVKISSNSIVNSGSIVSHDCVLGKNVHIAPGAMLAGGVVIGDNSLIGMGVTVYLGVRIGKNVVVNNGIRVFKDVPDNSVLRE